MNAREIFAATLKDRKGIDARAGRNDPPGPAPPLAPGPRRARSGRARYSHSQHTLRRLESQAREANRRAEKAESAVAPLRAKLETMRQRIEGLKVELRKARRQRKSRAKLAEVRAARNEKWPVLRRKLETLLNERPQRGVISQGALARAVGVNARLVFGWLTGEYSPNLETLALVAAWIQTHDDCPNLFPYHQGDSP